LQYLPHGIAIIAARAGVLPWISSLLAPPAAPLLCNSARTALILNFNWFACVSAFATLNVQIKIDHKDNQWHWFGVLHSSLRHTNRPLAARAFCASS
jgi:hypothetical protein